MPTSTAPTRRRRRATADELLAPAIHRHDSTYGKVTTEHGTIGADEPVIVFRAKDKLLPALLDAYAEMCAAAGSPTRHLKILAESRANIVAWQAENPPSRSRMGRSVASSASSAATSFSKALV